MRDVFGNFVCHNNKVDNVEAVLTKYKPSIAPLELSPNELIFINNPRSL